MQQWIEPALTAKGLGLALFPAAFLLGIIGAASSCCTPAVLGAMVAYSGAHKVQNRRAVAFSGIAFLIGTICALAALGAVVGLLGHAVGQKLNRYAQAIAGLLAVLLGLAVLKLLPFELPKRVIKPPRVAPNEVRAAIFGLVVGGSSLTCTFLSNPLLAVPLGLVALKGKLLWGAGLLGAFALGYSLPLALALVGMQVGLTRAKAVSQRVASVMRIVGGLLLIGIGFYFMATA